MHNTVVATKTISIELDVYDALVRHRLSPSESFSRVLRRARWDDREKGRAGDILTSLDHLPAPTDAQLNEWESIQRNDRPAEDKWTS
jgi:hypothetical protein